MTLDDAPPPGAPAVLLGPSPLKAGELLGRDHDDAVLGGYDELHAVSDGDLVLAPDVEVVVAPGCEEATARVATLLGRPGAPTVVLVAEVDQHDLLGYLLGLHHLRVDRVVRRGSATGFVVVRPDGPDAVGNDRRVLQTVAELSPEPAPADAPVRTAAPTATSAVRPGRPTPPLVRRLHRLQPHLEGRGRTRVTTAAAVVVVVAVLLVIGDAAGVPGVEALLVAALGLAAVALGIAVMVGVLHLARQVHRQTGRLESLQNQQLSALKALEARTARAESDSRKRDDLVLDFLEALAAADAVRELALHDRLRTILEKLRTGSER